MVICAPCDACECKQLMSLIVSLNCPSYLRLHKQNEPCITSSDSPIVIGNPRFYAGNKNASTAVISTGFAAQVIYERYKDSSNHALFTLPAWGMQYKSHIVEWADKFSCIYVVEDHLFDGGFCSWILESLIGSHNITKVRSRSISQSLIGYVASEDVILSQSDLFNIP